jgi:hypothetical protein
MASSTSLSPSATGRAGTLHEEQTLKREFAARAGAMRGQSARATATPTRPMAAISASYHEWRRTFIEQQ